MPCKIIVVLSRHQTRRYCQTLKTRIMRTQFVEGSKSLAAKMCPWACAMATVNGGYMCFESIEDYNTWKNKK